MTAADLVEYRKAKIEGLELAMLSSPEMIELLRQDRAEAQTMLRDAEAQLAAEERAEPRPLTWQDKERLWQDWQNIRVLRRSRMPLRMRARVLERFGEELYRSLKP